MRKNIIQHIGFIFIFIVSATFIAAQDAGKIRQSLDKGIAFLRNTQNEMGAWSPSPRTGIGPTTVILAGLLEAGVCIDDPMVVKALRLLESSTQEDGGVYTPDGFFQNYETCCAVMAFAKANEAAKKKTGKEPYKELLDKADKYLRQHQYTEETGTTPESPQYGGIGYGKNMTRPDLSNMNFFLDALKANGAKEDDPAIQKALVFVSRCQNLESEHNTMPFVAQNAEHLDGGFIYHNQPDREAGTEEEMKGLRSYGGMTYAGFKSLIYAGLTPEDKRYKAALDWITKHYTVKENPGRGAAGLYYYYQTMAKTLRVYQSPLLEDSGGKKNNWRADLSEHVIAIQKADGSWVNGESSQYMENDTQLVTGYALMTLGLCLQEL